MQVPIEIIFHNLDRSEAVEARLRERVQALERFFDHVTSCRVVVSAPHKHQNKGRIYHVKIELGMPGKPPLVVSQEPEVDHRHEDIDVAIKDAFDAAKRRLQDAAAKLKSRTKLERGRRKPAKGSGGGE